MGVPMVQKQKRRRSNLILGALLAVFLGVAATFFVLAMPIGMLQSVTTHTGLSRIMVQAEPPISPNDRMLLAVLAGILTAGIGWVLVDWLLFGRAGMRTLIREREDEYEDEDGDAFRPTDPLDLVSTGPVPTGEWALPTNGDTRRPLSARTDIGDPPPSNTPPGIQPAAMPAIDQLLPPIDQILPGIEAFAPPPAPARPPDPFVQKFPPPVAPVAPAPLTGHAGAGGGWLPTPGVRPDGSHPTSDIAVSPPIEVQAVEPEPAAPVFTLAPIPTIAPAPVEPVVRAVEDVIPPAAAPSLLPDPVQPAPPIAAGDPPPVIPPALPAAMVAQLVSDPQPTAAAPRQMAGFDRGELENLLERLERGLEKRRAAQARAAAQPPVAAPVAPVQDADTRPHFGPPSNYAATKPTAPAAYAAPQPVAPAGPATPLVYDLPPMPQAPAYNLAPLQPVPAQVPEEQPASILPTPNKAASGEDILDQPLHVTLDLLRNKVKL